jgi:beta-N-acetylhexosaminidase
MSLRELRRHVGRLAIVGFNGHTVPDDLRRLIDAFDLGGVIYFPRNLLDPPQVAELSREVAALARAWPIWISIDQEGGRVARLRAPFTEWPPVIALGRSGDDRLAERFAIALAKELLAVGINLDYAPVLDVHTNPANPVIGDRALAEQADLAARLGAVLISAMQGTGITACGKHFPGHGDTTADSHHELPVVEHVRRRLDDVEFVPFRRAIEAQVATMMTAHVLVPALDPDRIASFSPVIVRGILKDELGFPGVVISDDLGMKAVSARATFAETAVAAIAAGCDAALMCHASIDECVEAFEALIHAVEKDRIPSTRLDDAWARQRRAKERFLPGAAASVPIETVGCEAHQAIARQMAAWQ